MTAIEITHTHEAGTLLTGDPRPHQAVIKGSFRWSRNMGCWYIRNSRDRDAMMHTIEAAAEGLRKVGFEVTIKVDNDRRDRAIIEEDAAERSAQRTEALEAKAERLEGKAQTTFATAMAIADTIPFGQPILVGHHSERRHRKDLARIDGGMVKSFELHHEAEDAARRAQAATGRQAQRESMGTTLRRISKLEAEVRDIERKLTPCKGSKLRARNQIAGKISCPVCFQHVELIEHPDAASELPQHGEATGAWAERLEARKVSNLADIEYWREHVAGLENNGVKIWGPDDFQPGDRTDDGTVVRVNKKSLSVVWDQMPHWTNTVPFDKVKSKDEITDEQRVTFLAIAKKSINEAKERAQAQIAARERT